MPPLLEANKILAWVILANLILAAFIGATFGPRLRPEFIVRPPKHRLTKLAEAAWALALLGGQAWGLYQVVRYGADWNTKGAAWWMFYLIAAALVVFRLDELIDFWQKRKNHDPSY